MKKKRFLFYMGHPAHYHNISHVSAALQEKGHEIVWVARDKDVLFNLIERSPFKIILIKENRKNNSKSSLIFSILLREIRMIIICIFNRPDALIGTDIVITHVGKLLRIPSIILNEDDAKEVPFLAKFGFKYSDVTLSPFSCDIKPYHRNKVEYNGYHELAYLHPKYFVPDRKKIEHLFNGCEKYFIIRFAKLVAHHDVGKTGISKEVTLEIIKALSPFGKIYITSEGSLDPEFEPFRINISPLDIHHALYFADIYIGDSQTMAAEAAVLGTPSIRFNDFVGKLGYLEELEHTYHLTYGIKTIEPERLIEKIKEVVKDPLAKTKWAERRKKMLDSNIDVAAFWVWFFENYPLSMKQIRSGSPMLENFKATSS